MMPYCLNVLTAEILLTTYNFNLGIKIKNRQHKLDYISNFALARFSYFLSSQLIKKLGFVILAEGENSKIL